MTFAMISIIKIQMCVCLLKLDFIIEILTVCILLMAITCIGMMATHLTPQDLVVGQQYIAELSSCLDILTSQISYQYGIEVNIVKLMILPNVNILGV